jgi:putative redox protein
MGEINEVKVALEDGMLFTGTGHPIADGFSVQMDAAVEVGGQGRGMRPQSLVLVGLGGCTGMDVISILQKKRQAVHGLTVEISGVQAETAPNVYTDVEIMFVVTGENVDPDAVERAMELSATKYCSASAMFERSGAKITTGYRIEEAVATT